MAKMWRSMCQHNDDQLKAVSGLKSLDVSGSVDSGSGAAIETSREHHERTKQLCIAVEQWNSQFEKMVTNQRQYVNSLNGWLKLNLIPIESTLREKASAAAASSPPRNPTPPPIQPLLLSWHDHLEKLPDDVAKSSIFSFKEVIKSIALHQEEEMKLREKRDGTRREYLRKKQGFEEWYQRHVQRRTPPPRGADDGAETASKDPAVERRIAVEMLKKRLDEETDEHRKHCVHVREKSLASLKIRLPELFRALSDYSHACFDAYESLRMVIQSQNLLNHQEEPS
ncbi:hypothetical protein M569_16812 [Genlisea aurea]|uniref:DUF632 domain-containing protein n=1 Tax=Genlisea aurea TaxID=192259 RepID=S8BTT7_9LAMI|nr:hypothetical protein M569_16812 [Genlisea aurea]